MIEYIFAFEPNYETFNFLKKNFTNSNITFFNYALGAKNFRSKINIGFDSDDYFRYKAKFDNDGKMLSSVKQKELIKK